LQWNLALIYSDVLSYYSRGDPGGRRVSWTPTFHVRGQLWVLRPHSYLMNIALRLSGWRDFDVNLRPNRHNSKDLIAKAIRISRAKFHCNRLTTVQDIQDYVSLIFGTHCSSWLYHLLSPFCQLVYAVTNLQLAQVSQTLCHSCTVVACLPRTCWDTSLNNTTSNNINYT